MSRVYRVTKDEFLELLSFAQRSHLAKNEPIPEITNEGIERLESCLATPFQTFLDFDLYRGFNNKAAMLLYLLIKNHPLQNGNKRMALLTFAYMFKKNRKKFPFSSNELYLLAKSIANSKDKDKAIEEIELLFKKYL